MEILNSTIMVTVVAPHLNEVVENHKEEQDDSQEVGEHGQLDVTNHFDLFGQV